MKVELKEKTVNEVLITLSLEQASQLSLLLGYAVNDKNSLFQKNRKRLGLLADFLDDVLSDAEIE